MGGIPMSHGKIKMRNQTTQLKLKKKVSRHLLKECMKIANRYTIVLYLTNCQEI